MTTAVLTRPREATSERFACFGGEVLVLVEHPDPGQARVLAGLAHGLALDVHRRLSRFDAGSELSRLNRDPRPAFAASTLLCRFADAVRTAGELSGGLVDATCLDAVEAAGYREHWTPGATFAPGPPPGPLAGHWRAVRAARGTVRRPPGVRLDSGGLGKGLAADRIAEAIAGASRWAVVCGGDLRAGGLDAAPRAVQVTDPYRNDVVLHRLELAPGWAAATSGITRRRWPGGHHLIDPRTGAPAATGVVQVTARAPTALEAEVRAKAALLAGPDLAAWHLPWGGVVVGEHGGVEVVR